MNNDNNTQTERARRVRTGFTLLELLVVLVIMGILAGVVTLNLVGAADRAREQTTRTSMETIKGGLTTYRFNYGLYPETGDLDALKRENIIVKDFTDAWGSPLEYYSPTQNAAYELISLGADRTYGTEDDIIIYPDTDD